MKQNKGITLIALIITVIVLLILAGVAISMALGENGLLNNSKFAVGKYKNSAEQEENELAKIDSYISANRETVTIDKSSYEELIARISALEAKTNFTSPILLTNATLPCTDEATRAGGTYKASSSQYTKVDSENLSKYLTYTEGIGWTVKKSGFYYVYTYVMHSFYKTAGGVIANLYINNGKHVLTNDSVSSGYITAHSQGQAPIYLNENDVIDFSFELGSAGIWSGATFNIYAMFE